MTNTTTVASIGADGSNQALDLMTTLLELIGACDVISEMLTLLLLAAVSDDDTPLEPEVGEVRQGHTYSGGDPSNPKSWVR
jgi:hypothetical protein